MNERKRGTEVVGDRPIDRAIVPALRLHERVEKTRATRVAEQRLFPTSPESSTVIRFTRQTLPGVTEPRYGIEIGTRHQSELFLWGSVATMNGGVTYSDWAPMQAVMAAHDEPETHEQEQTRSELFRFVSNPFISHEVTKGLIIPAPIEDFETRQFLQFCQHLMEDRWPHDVVIPTGPYGESEPASDVMRQLFERMPVTEITRFSEWEQVNADHILESITDGDDKPIALRYSRRTAPVITLPSTRRTIPATQAEHWFYYGDGTESQYFTTYFIDGIVRDGFRHQEPKDEIDRINDDAAEKNRVYLNKKLRPRADETLEEEGVQILEGLGRPRFRSV